MLAETIVAKTELPGNVQPVKAASLLGVHQQDLREFMLKKEGDAVAKDETIATSKSFFGLFKAHCRSPVQGTLESISDVTGQVIIREPPIPVVVDAYIDGRVAEVMPGEGVVVEAEGAFLQGIFGVGGETIGILQMVVKTPDEELSEAHLKPEHAGKVVVGGSLIRIPALKRAIAVGVKAVVVGGLDDQDLRALLGYDLGVAITGQESIGCTVVVTEGFGKMTHGPSDIRPPGITAGKEGFGQRSDPDPGRRHAPRDRDPTRRPQGSIARAEAQNEGMTVGSLVRVIRVPYFGRLGTVAALPPELQVLESEAKVRVLKVRFDSGEEATLPRANVEMIES